MDDNITVQVFFEFWTIIAFVAAIIVAVDWR